MLMVKVGKIAVAQS